jgi:hypothetical protein
MAKSLAIGSAGSARSKKVSGRAPVASSAAGRRTHSRSMGVTTKEGSNGDNSDPNPFGGISDHEECEEGPGLHARYTTNVAGIVKTVTPSIVSDIYRAFLIGISR